MSKRKETLTADKLAEKKFNRKSIFVLILFIIAVTLLIWFVPRWLAQEEMLDYQTIEINGDTLTVIFSEKSSTENRRTNPEMHITEETNTTNHYGYFLELYDSALNKSLHKIEFNSPVRSIQSTPQLRVFPNGIIWLVSVSNDTFEDKPGFILKFEIKDNNIIQMDFSLDKKWRIRDIEANKVVITDGNTFEGTYYNEITGCTYFDLETEEIVELTGFF